LLRDLAEHQIPQALVSSSYRILVDAVLAELPGHPFVISLAGDEVTHGKPDPEPYATAADRLGVAIGDCVVIEDTSTGCRSGAAAGARVVYCPSVAGSGAAEPGWRTVGSLEAVSYRWLSAWPVTEPGSTGPGSTGPR
jgi:beta-phosphoglucomutase-like phosphatase (HAD superfamily)